MKKIILFILVFSSLIVFSKSLFAQEGTMQQGLKKKTQQDVGVVTGSEQAEAQVAAEEVKKSPSPSAQALESASDKAKFKRSEEVVSEGKDSSDLVKKYDQYYDADKFKVLAGKDGKLTKKEWEKNRTKQEAAVFGDVRWKKLLKFDADKDGKISGKEASAYKLAEKQFLEKHPKATEAAYEEWRQVE